MTATAPPPASEDLSAASQGPESGGPESVGPESTGPEAKGPETGSSEPRPSDSRAASLRARLTKWSLTASTSRKLAYGLAAAAVLSTLSTALILVGQTGQDQDIETVLSLLYLDGILLLLLGLVVARRLVAVWLERQRGQAGSGLHVRLALLFSLVATAPAILVAIFSAVFLNYGLQTWFNDRVSTALDRSLVVAKAYLKEHQDNFGADILGVANDLNFNASLLSRDPWRMGSVLTGHMTERSLTEVLILDGQGKVLSRPAFSLAGDLVELPKEAYDKAGQGKLALMPSDSPDRVRGMVKLSRYVDTYLIVERFVDPRVLTHIERIQNAVKEYQTLRQEQGGIQISFVLIFVVVSLLLLLAAVWTGLTVSTQLVKPISSLIEAADKVRSGDLDVRVAPSDADDEISSLGRAFNRMTAQIRSQQDGLMDANRQLDERRRFTETVLAGVSAGVIGLDANGRITLPNRSAKKLLKSDLDAAVGKPLDDVVPEMGALMEEALRQPYRSHQSEVRLIRKGETLTLLVSIVSERLAGELLGYILTFDDITELQSAQRKAAWADVARRIAHEIKNPLTPIQLSAERLKRKYTKEISTDPDIFTTCTETIIRQVEDIGRMVDEFSSFARMPQPSMSPDNLVKLTRDVFFLEQTRNPHIEYDLEIPGDVVNLRCDGQQVSRALTNIIKNAAESVDGRLSDATRGGNNPGEQDAEARKSGTEVTKSDDIPASAERGHISVRIVDDRDGDGDGEVSVIVEDNGKGLPRDDRERLTEPYVTTRTKGTGLGLAIVKKIMEDHDGRLLLEDRQGPGALVSLVFRDLQANDNARSQTDPMKVATALMKPGS